MEIKGITIHNTGNTKSAKEEYETLLKNQSIDLCHYLVDETEVIEVWNVENHAFHTGKGYDFGNLYTIAVEICRSQSDLETYLKAQKKAVAFIKKLMKKYNLTKDDIYFHNDFNSQSSCPHRILELYKSKGGFIDECKL